MPKNSKVTQREHSSEHVTESVADLLAHEEPVDYKRSVLNVTGEAWDKQKDVEEELDSEKRPAWNSKLQDILAQIGYSVGLGNVWRFPFLCRKEKGGAYLVPYLVLLIIIGLPLFFLELAVGQRIRRGSIGVWNYICPRLGGIGYASCLIKGIQSSGKVMYFSSLFPYVVLLCFLVRGLLLRGAVDGIVHMFMPKLDKMLDPQVWREAATQVFFALGLGFGGVIAFSSYNKQDNNCHFDATLVSFINFFTSVLATLVVFAVLGFKANIMNEKCVVENAEKILGYLNTHVLSHDLIPPHVNFSHLTAKDYSEMYHVIQTVKEGHFQELDLDPCLLEDELNKSVQGTGLAFIAFTEAMTHFPASPFWSVMFFLMLINLGLGSMIGTMAGITTPIVDTFKVRKEVFTVGCCIVAFLIGLIFVQHSGNYFVTMFDDYSATLPLTVVVILENIAVAWIYGTKKFMQELTEMLGFRPCVFYFYAWKYISPLCMAVLMTASIIQLGVSPPGYSAWIREEAVERFLYYPAWAMAILISLIILACLPLPVVFILRQFHLVSDGSNALSVTYKKGRMMKDISNLEDNDETRFILSKVPSEAPSPMPTHRSYLGPGNSSPLELSAAPNGRYGSGYHLASTPESEL
nr:sodium-dependent neutral amino acid transporter SLC6A17 [Pelodiscus sinensis]|eukprot:XP_014433714.1 sodium-dependent neutral amino acid transporter SLC6A17 [Pelodiscus sinensis]